MLGNAFMSCEPLSFGKSNPETSSSVTYGFVFPKLVVGFGFHHASSFSQSIKILCRLMGLYIKHFRATPLTLHSQFTHRSVHSFTLLRRERFKTYECALTLYISKLSITKLAHTVTNYKCSRNQSTFKLVKLLLN